MTTLLIVSGLCALVLGAEALVRGASRLARIVGLSPLIIGLTVVAFGTSAPELAVSVKAGLAGQADIAIGNVVGSNLLNVLLILGIAAAITPLAVSQQLVRLDVPIMIGVSIVLWLFAVDLQISRLEGMVLFAGIIFYNLALLQIARRHPHPVPTPDQPENTAVVSTGRHPKLAAVGYVLLGLALLVLGAQWLVDGATAFARVMGISELVIGLTIVAGGTSLPELATSVVASIRKERDIAVGNVVGSNIFNILAVLGAGAIVADGVAVSQVALSFDIPVMVATAAFCLPIFFSGGRISRLEGCVFLAYYAAYTALLILGTRFPGSYTTFSIALAGFVLPMIFIGIIQGVAQYRASSRLSATAW